MSYFEPNNVHPNAARLLPAAVAQLRLFAPRYNADIIPLHGKRLLPADVCPDHIMVTEELEVFEILTSEICTKILSQVDNTTGLTGSNQNHSVRYTDASGDEWGLSLYAKVLSEKKWLSLDSISLILFKDGNLFLPVGSCMLSRIMASLENELRDRGVLVVSIENIITEAGACAAKKAGFRLWFNSARQWGDYIIQYQ